ncbi:MAG: cytochrome bd ubiquinol oxidase subunit [Solirubrobacteraceae bacterium]|jgi:cytochrome d ubiquinol oxidase subunit II|nr:cytochrome bd ubiquinol oxidase subunit [Solirubrobacteraceae bacterium]
MSLAGILMVIILVGLVLYVVLGGADFGAAVWQVLAGRGPRAEEIREHAHESMAPVWEANHVWLIFVLTVLWTAFPVALGSIASTLCVPLFAAGLGIILRGAAYALRTGTSSPTQVKAIDMVSAISSILTPFALGAAIGGIASGRVPVGNAKGDLITSWINPTSLVVGLLSVVTSAYLASVFLAADAVRRDEPELAVEFRRRALGSAALAGVLAIGGLVVLRSDARPLFDALVGGAGLVGLIVSVAAGVLTGLALWRGRHEAARYGSALAVAAIVAGWALAQNPVILPGLTVAQAAAPHDTLVATLVAIIAGGAILFPSLALLFRLVLGGRLGTGGEETAAPGPRRLLEASSNRLEVRVAIACVVAGFGFLTVADAGWAHAIGVVALLAAIGLGFLAAVPALLPE